LEVDTLLICLAPELDKKYEKLYAYLQDDITCKMPSIALVLDLLCSTFEQKIEARALFDPQAPLLKYRLLEMAHGSPDGLSPLPSRVLKMDDRMVNFILGFRQMDARLVPVARLDSPALSLRELCRPKRCNQDQKLCLFPFWTPIDITEGAYFLFTWPYGAGKRSLAGAVCRDLELL